MDQQEKRTGEDLESPMGAVTRMLTPDLGQLCPPVAVVPCPLSTWASPGPSAWGSTWAPGIQGKRADLQPGRATDN